MKLLYRETSLRALLIGSIILLPLLAILAALQWRVIESFIVESGSMAPTLEKYDRVIVDLRGGHSPRLGDVVAFDKLDEPGNTKLVKRVLGLEGDVISIRDGRTYRNGSPIEEPYLAPSNRRVDRPDLEYHVGPGQFFAAGDNRNFSLDSFDYGPRPIDTIRGRAWFIYWPPKRARMLDAQPASGSVSGAG